MRWSRIKESLQATRGRRWAVRYLRVLVFIALFSNFLANDRPLIASYKGEIRFPVIRCVAELFTGPRPYGDLPGRSWRLAKTDWAIWPPIPYTAGELDIANSNFKSPFDEQKVKSIFDRHWLGTDRNGRDLLAGLIRGSKIALLVGLIAMSIALVIGIFLGGIAGYFGNDRYRDKRYKIWAWSIGAFVGLTYALAVGIPFFTDRPLVETLMMLGIPVLMMGFLLSWLFEVIARFWPWFNKTISLAIDGMVMRLIELFNSFPTLVLLIAILPAIDSPSILTVMLVIGLIRWTGIARFVRAELLRIRNLPYIDAARLSGFSHGRILFRHALPNALGPVVIAISFGMAGAILLEAYLSFLGIGLSSDQVSWGSLLRQSRDQPAAWWLAIFPGLAIFLTVLSLNVLGEALRD